LKAIIQRVSRAEVRVNGRMIGEIGPGVVTLLGVARGDCLETAEQLIAKIVRLRLFSDDNDKMNRSLIDIQGEHLIVSQFTLYGDCRKGNRPSFGEAAEPQLARSIYEHALRYSHSLGVRTASGEFQANMQVSLVNDGPVTFVLESKGK